MFSFGSKKSGRRPATTALVTHSLDLSPEARSDQTSFRIRGSVEGEVDLICRSIGLSGPEDFAIPAAAWEASLKARRSPFLIRSKDGTNSTDVGIESTCSQAEVSIPPILARPPYMKLVEFDGARSAWDLVRSFGPTDVKEGKVRDGVEVGEAADERSEDCGVESLSTSNDDDSSSVATESMFLVRPNGRIRRVVGSWIRGQLLGSGSFGTVYEGIGDDGGFFAVKEVSLLEKGSSAQQCIFQLEQEIALLSQFEHENIVQYYGTDKEESKLFIFLELVTQGSLASLYHKYRLRHTQVSAYTRQILKGLQYLHERNVVHRDIKCSNILVHANGSVKLADFGLAKEMSKLNDLKSCKGSVYWMAPEVINPKKTYGYAADIWSLGCTVLEMLTRQIPYPQLEWQHAFFKIGHGDQPPIPCHLSKEAQDFIRQCVQVDPNSRPTAAQLLEHPFIRRPINI